MRWSRRKQVQASASKCWCASLREARHPKQANKSWRNTMQASRDRETWLAFVPPSIPSLYFSSLTHIDPPRPTGSNLSLTRSCIFQVPSCLARRERMVVRSTSIRAMHDSKSSQAAALSGSEHELTHTHIQTYRTRTHACTHLLLDKVL